MIRKILQSDLPRLKELGFDHEIGPDFLEGICAVDENDVVVMFAGAWSRAEVHMCTDPSFSTPGARLALLSQVHDAMESELKSRNVGQAITWFDESKKRFQSRLKRLGWVKSEFTGWYRIVR
jgi:hypothetical protein